MLLFVAKLGNSSWVTPYTLCLIMLSLLEGILCFIFSFSYFTKYNHFCLVDIVQFNELLNRCHGKNGAKNYQLFFFHLVMQKRRETWCPGSKKTRYLRQSIGGHAFQGTGVRTPVKTLKRILPPRLFQSPDGQLVSLIEEDEGNLNEVQKTSLANFSWRSNVFTC